jgi:hypothetical protein
MILSALGWIAALGLLAVAVSSGWHGFRDRTRGSFAAAGMYAGTAFILLAIDGALSWAAAIVLAVLSLGAATGLVLAGGRDGAGKAALGHAGAGMGHLGADARGIWRRLLARASGGDPEPEASSPEAAVAEAATTRSIPSVMEDPALGLAPEPAELVSGQIPAPAPYAALAQYIAGFEPEDDMSLRMFMEGLAAGSVMVADAWHHFADTCLNSVGLDPAFVAGILEAGDSAGAHGSLLAQVIKRLSVIYGAVQEWVAAHGPLPHKAREWLTGGDM